MGCAQCDWCVAIRKWATWGPRLREEKRVEAERREREREERGWATGCKKKRKKAETDAERTAREEKEKREVADNEQKLKCSGLVDKMQCCEGSKIEKCIICDKTYHSHAVSKGKVVKRKRDEKTLATVNECPHCLANKRFEDIMPHLKQKGRKGSHGEKLYIDTLLNIEALNRFVNRVFKMLPDLLWHTPEQVINSLEIVGKSHSGAKKDTIRTFVNATAVEGQEEEDENGRTRKKLHKKQEGDAAKLSLDNCPNRDALSAEVEAKQKQLSEWRDKLQTELSEEDQELLTTIFVKGDVTQREYAKNTGRHESSVSRDLKRLEQEYPRLKELPRARSE